jgi:3-oxoacyl-[acyl-carrier-protein] synthase III
VVDVGAFAGVFGAQERPFDSIAGLDGVMARHNIPLGLATMGCRSFAQTDGPPESLVADAIAASLAIGAVPASVISHVIFATSDNHLHQLGDGFARAVLQPLGLTHVLPILISLQKCASSIVALDLARAALVAQGGGTALVVGFDILGADDDERVKSFALFGDGAACCIVSTEGALDFRIDGCAVRTDPAGMCGEDTFDSRKSAARGAVDAALAAAAATTADIAACFSTNLFKPVSMFNASICGLSPARISVLTAERRGHCGNADWMVNLAAYADAGRIEPGARYLAQAFAPGFCACAVLTAHSGA